MLSSGTGNDSGPGGYGDWNQETKDKFDELRRREEEAKRRSREAKDRLDRLQRERLSKKKDNK